MAIALPGRAQKSLNVNVATNIPNTSGLRKAQGQVGQVLAGIGQRAAEKQFQADVQEFSADASLSTKKQYQEYTDLLARNIDEDGRIKAELKGLDGNVVASIPNEVNAEGKEVRPTFSQASNNFLEKVRAAHVERAANIEQETSYLSNIEGFRQQSALKANAYSKELRATRIDQKAVRRNGEQALKVDQKTNFKLVSDRLRDNIKANEALPLGRKRKDELNTQAKAVAVTTLKSNVHTRNTILTAEINNKNTSAEQKTEFMLERKEMIEGYQEMLFGVAEPVNVVKRKEQTIREIQNQDKSLRESYELAKASGEDSMTGGMLADVLASFSKDTAALQAEIDKERATAPKGTFDGTFEEDAQLGTSLASNMTFSERVAEREWLTKEVAKTDATRALSPVYTINALAKSAQAGEYRGQPEVFMAKAAIATQNLEPEIKIKTLAALQGDFIVSEAVANSIFTDVGTAQANIDKTLDTLSTETVAQLAKESNISEDTKKAIALGVQGKPERKQLDANFKARMGQINVERMRDFPKFAAKYDKQFREQVNAASDAMIVYESAVASPTSTPLDINKATRNLQRIVSAKKARLNELAQKSGVPYQNISVMTGPEVQSYRGMILRAKDTGKPERLVNALNSISELYQNDAHKAVSQIFETDKNLSAAKAGSDEALLAYMATLPPGANQNNAALAFLNKSKFLSKPDELTELKSKVSKAFESTDLREYSFRWGDNVNLHKYQTTATQYNANAAETMGVITAQYFAKDFSGGVSGRDMDLDDAVDKVVNAMVTDRQFYPNQGESYVTLSKELNAKLSLTPSQGYRDNVVRGFLEKASDADFIKAHVDAKSLIKVKDQKAIDATTENWADGNARFVTSKNSDAFVLQVRNDEDSPWVQAFKDGKPSVFKTESIQMFGKLWADQQEAKREAKLDAKVFDLRNKAALNTAKQDKQVKELRKKILDRKKNK